MTATMTTTTVGRLKPGARFVSPTLGQVVTVEHIRPDGRGRLAITSRQTPQHKAHVEMHHPGKEITTP